MNQVSRNSPQQQVAGVLILVMIFSSVLGASGLQDFLWISGISALVAFILLWPRMSRIQHIQCGIFFSVGFIGLGLAWINGYREIPVQKFITQNHLLISLLSAVSFLRLITDTRLETPEVIQTGTKAFWQTIGGVHLFASVINISAFIIFGDALKKMDALIEQLRPRFNEGLRSLHSGPRFSQQWEPACFMPPAQNGLIYFRYLFPLPCWALRLPGRNTASEKAATWIYSKDIR
jgi:hypothetical protein